MSNDGHVQKRYLSAEVVFGQVREDTALERSLARGGCLCIASGGETAFDLLLGGADRVLAVDVNPAQVWLLELKVAILRELSLAEAQEALTVHALGAFEKVKGLVSAEAAAYFSARPRLLEGGLQNCGRVDRMLAVLATLFQRSIHGRALVLELLSQPDLAAQRELFDERWNTPRWRLALRLLCNRATLRVLFGSTAVAGLSAHAVLSFREEILRVVRNVPANRNPYVWQAMLGTYPPDGLPEWMTSETLRGRLDRLTFRVADLASPLREDAFDTICLSNVFDVTDATYPDTLISALLSGAPNGGRVIGRSFFPGRLDLVARGKGKLKPIQTPDWTDRSFFCRIVEIVEVSR